MIVNSSFANAFILRLICVKICRSRIQRYSADRTIFIAENFLGKYFRDSCRFENGRQSILAITVYIA